MSHHRVNTKRGQQRARAPDPVVGEQVARAPVGSAQCPLYQFVFAHQLVRVLAVVLFLAFLTQPLERAAAAEVAGATAGNESAADPLAAPATASVDATADSGSPPAAENDGTVDATPGAVPAGSDVLNAADSDSKSETKPEPDPDPNRDSDGADAPQPPNREDRPASSDPDPDPRDGGSDATSGEAGVTEVERIPPSGAPLPATSSSAVTAPSEPATTTGRVTADGSASTTPPDLRSPAVAGTSTNTSSSTSNNPGLELASSTTDTPSGAVTSTRPTESADAAGGGENASGGGGRAPADPASSTAASTSAAGTEMDVEDREVQKNQAPTSNPVDDTSATSGAGTADHASTSGAFKRAKAAASSSASTTAQTPTTAADATEPTPLSVVVEREQEYAFSREECTRIADGSFYCQDVSTASSGRDELVALRDAGGDLEIYLVRDGNRQQLTHNRVDDASPHYDARSETIVWHRLVNDRYQIMSYDLETGEETQLTETSVNDMEPARHGNRTVWQRWVVDNWEIMLREGDTTVQLTESPGHDIDPQVRGELVIWNGRSEGGTQRLMVYDASTGEITTLNDTTGVSVGNPRFVMMYEAMYENGDVVTKGTIWRLER